MNLRLPPVCAVVAIHSDAHVRLRYAVDIDDATNDNRAKRQHNIAKVPFFIRRNLGPSATDYSEVRVLEIEFKATSVS